MTADAIKVTWIELLKRSVNAWMADKALRLSAALAYYSVFSIAPLLVICIAVAGMVLGDDAVAGRVHAQLKVYIGSPAATALESMVQSAARPTESVVATITGFAALLLGASGVFGALKDALNTIWEVKPKEGTGFMAFAREKFLNFGMVLVIGFLLLVSLVLSTAIASLHDDLEVLVQLPAILWTVVSALLSIGVATTLFAWIFKVLPDVTTRWRDVWVGAFITAILFEVGKTGLSWYLGRESTANAYGAAGSVVLLLLWVYYASCILLFGAEFTQEYAHSRGRILVPEAGGEWATAGDRANEGLDQQDAAGSSLQVPHLLARGREEVSAHAQALRDHIDPRQVLKRGAEEHPALLLGGGLAAGLLASLLMFRRSQQGVAPAPFHRGSHTHAPAPPASLPGQLLGEAAHMLLPLVVMPMFEKFVKQRLQRSQTPH